MIKYIKTFFLWLLPILRSAGIQVAADELARVAYSDRVRKPRTYGSRDYTPYGFRPRTRREAVRNVGRAVREAEEFKQPFNMVDNKPFHDVLMVAFDLKGRSARDVHEWLQSVMPGGDSTYKSLNHGDIHLDSWWVANDERFDRSDCDSAVFVSKGNQRVARQLLRDAGLVE